MNSAAIAELYVILLSTVGSKAHGTSLEDGGDTDQMGVCIEPPERVIGLQAFEHHVYRTAQGDARSGPGDVDRVVYSLRKFCRLALGGNPTILALLYTKPDVICTAYGEKLLAIRRDFASKHAISAFLGYLTQQKERLLGIRGQVDTKRPELIAKHGYDTKYASHALRLGLQGIEYAETGEMSMPMRDRGRVLAVRAGEFSLAEVVTQIETQERLLVEARSNSILPNEPEHAKVDKFLVDIYQRYWRQHNARS